MPDTLNNRLRYLAESNRQQSAARVTVFQAIARCVEDKAHATNVAKRIGNSRVPRASRSQPRQGEASLFLSWIHVQPIE